MATAKSASALNELVNPFAASTNPQTLQYNALRDSMKADTDSRWSAQHGENITNMLGAGLGLGMGGMALYHMLRAMKVPGGKEKRYKDTAAGLPSPPEKLATFMGDVGENVVKQIGAVPGMLSENVLAPLGLAQNSSAKADPDILRGSLATVGGMGAGLLGLYGGGKMVNKVMDMKNKADADDEVEEARKRYYAILTGKDKAATALDSAYEKAAEGGLLGGAYHAVTDTIPRGLTTAGLLATLAAGGVGAHYMYNRTADRTRGENLAKAQASRARMRGLPSVYVDPEQLAQVKQLAEQKPHE